MAGTDPSQDDYELSTCFIMTPALSATASSLSSRRGSVVSFGSAYSISSFSTDYTPLSPPTPVSRQFHAQSYPRGPATPPNSGNSSLGDAFDSEPPYLYTLSAPSVGENFGCGELENHFADLTAGWGCHNYDQDASPTAQGFLFCPSVDPHFAGQATVDIRPGFSGVHGISQNSPPTVLPSQTLKSPNPPASTLATPFVSPKTPAQLSPYSTYFDQTPSSLSFDYSAEKELAGRYITPNSCKTSRKHPKQEDDSDDEDPSGKRAPRIPFTVNRVEENAKKPNQCHICHKGFDRHEHLTRHNKTDGHREMQEKNGLVPAPQTKYVCVFCNKEFTRSDNLRPHLLTHMHDGGPNFKNASVTREQVKAHNLQKIDPRQNQDMALKKVPSKKARAKRRK